MKTVRWGVALLVSGAGIWFALHGVIWGDVRLALERVHHFELLLFIPLSGGLEYLIRTERWRLLLSESRDHRGRLFPIVAGAFFMNTVLPFRAGEAARIFWTHREMGRPLAATVAALAVDRFMDSLALVLLFLTALALRPGTAISRGSVLGLFALGMAGVVFFVVLARFSAKISAWSVCLSLPVFFRRVILSFVEGAAPLRSFRTLAVTLLLSASLWSLLAAVFLWAGRIFGLPLTWAEACLLLAGLALGVAIPSTPGYIGTYEAAGVATLSVLGYEKSVAFPFIASIHLIQIVGTVLWGTPSLLVLMRSRKKKDPED
ncbi:MAG: flippase-like domain-containing protein [Elusimicrobia bacterium]|nr:flippase-like domain-containing protein [Elusimicrobiota bacterium]